MTFSGSDTNLITQKTPGKNRGFFYGVITGHLRNVMPAHFAAFCFKALSEAEGQKLELFDPHQAESSQDLP
jgi:hypothetical protein